MYGFHLFWRALLDHVHCVRPFARSPSPGSALLSRLEPLLLRHGVRLTLSGHMHLYERTHATVNGTLAGARAPVHVVVGIGGVMLGEFHSDAPAWSASRCRIR